MVIIPVGLALFVLITKPVSVLNISVVHLLLKLEIALRHSPLVGRETMQVNVKLLSGKKKAFNIKYQHFFCPNMKYNKWL